MRRRGCAGKPRQARRRDGKMFRFTYHRIPSLPRLAWCARLIRGCDEIVVEHGAWVEAHDTFFAEGAWDGAFHRGDLDAAQILLGSGGCVGSENAVFCTTTHTMERLHGARIGAEFFLSNSFSYLLAATGDAPELNYRYYERDFMTFLKGRQRAARAVPTARGRQVRLYYGEKLHINANLDVRLEAFPEGPSFATYQEYVDCINTLVARLHKNAVDPSRTIRYTPLSTLSSGYDSPACTVFAKTVGCRSALTLVKAREHYNAHGSSLADTEDSGTEIAKYLGVDLIPLRRDAYLERDDYPEAEFLATGNGGDDVVIGTAEDHLPGRMLFTGFLGDTLWGPRPIDPAAARNYVYTFPAGGTLGEFRLRTGFIHLPIPLLTYPRQPQIARISASEAMAPWRVGGHYDRPIPRRLVEGSGVPRAIYAREKKAVTQPLWLPTDFQAISEMLSTRSRSSLLAYAKSRAVRSRLSAMSKIKELYSPLLVPAAAAFNWYGSKLARRLGIKALPTLHTGQFRSSVLFSTPAGLKFHWAVETVSRRYQDTRFCAGKSVAAWPARDLDTGSKKWMPTSKSA